jgi:hypothetical protein
MHRCFLLWDASVFPIPHGKRLGVNVQDPKGQIVVTPCRTERPRAGTAAGSEIHELVELFRGLFVADFRTWLRRSLIRLGI